MGGPGAAGWLEVVAGRISAAHADDGLVIDISPRGVRQAAALARHQE